MNITDQLALQDLMARYVDGANRRDVQLWRSTWAEDATWRLMGNEVQGLEAIVTLWEQALQGFEVALLLPGSGTFAVAGDTAEGHWYLQELTRSHGGADTLMISRYQDRYRRVDGEWKYQAREYCVLHSSTPGDGSRHTSPLPGKE